MTRSASETLERELGAALRAELARPISAQVRARVERRLAASVGVFGVGPELPPRPPVPAVGAQVLSRALSLIAPIVVGTGIGAAGYASLEPRRIETPAPARAMLTTPVASTTAPAGAGLANAASASAAAPAPAPAPAVAPPFVEARRAGIRIAVPAKPAQSAISQSENAAALDGLAEQQRLLDRARVALKSGDVAACRSALAEHQTRHPKSLFDEERAALWIKASALAGDREALREQFVRFERRHPGSPLLPSLRALVGQP